MDGGLGHYCQLYSKKYGKEFCIINKASRTMSRLYTVINDPMTQGHKLTAVQ
jgi:hypothetical protein